MATTRSFSNMLNEYLAYDLLMEELEKRSYLLQRVDKDSDWKGGPMQIPFEAQRASSMKYGELTAEGDISEFKYVRGEISDYRELWSSMVWNQRDLYEHDGKFKEQSFLKDLPKQLERFIDGIKDAVSVNLLNGDHFATLTADATANDGIMSVDRPERFCLDQKVIINDSDDIPITAYVRAIDINAKSIELVTTRGGATVVDFSANNMTTANAARAYNDGAQTAGNAFTSLRDQLLSAANSGSATIFGQTKLAYPYLQAVNIDGSGVTATNILDRIFDGWTNVMTLGQGQADTLLVSYKHLGSIMKLLEAGAGAYRHVSTKATIYGYTELVILGVKGSLTIVGVHEMDDDVIYYLDFRSMKFHSNEFFRKHTDPDGNNYHTVRGVTGYKYICDVSLYGEFVVNAPWKNGVMHGINY